ncbi:hypothetical protein LIER_22847 [Lithospermum erythrorhizon]|uniref:VTT domain-containing protein n=1 Tax=Lithospermum erythrorhizon TaxID=34254 RepID=A0AAV3QYP9_LITER
MKYGGFGDDESLVVDQKGDFLKLNGEDEESSGSSSSIIGSSCCSTRGIGSFWWSFWWWARLMLVFVFLGVLAAVFLKWVCPFFMDKEVIPLINWERGTFSNLVLAVLVVTSMALFPVLLLPSSPSMWVAGLTFGYSYGFLLIIGGMTIGMSLPYFIGHVFYHKIHGLMERYPKKATLIKLAGDGNSFDQFRAVSLIRISPFPYCIYNYCAVATGVKYFPYLLGSLLGVVPEVFVALYTGILIKALADASQDQRSLSTQEILFNVAGFCFTIATTVIITIYANRRLKQLQQEELLVQ